MRQPKTMLTATLVSGLILFFTASGWGIDRVKKTKDPQERKETTSQESVNKEKTSPENKSLPQNPSDKSDRENPPAEPEKKSTEPDVQKAKTEGIIKRMIKEDYDYFIDKNKNGIDDRLEIREKPKSSKEPKAKKKKEKPQ